MKNNNLIIALFGIILLSACQKKDNSGFDSSKLNIKISKPTEAQVFKKGDTVFISATADYISELHGYSMSIIDTNSQQSFFDVDEHLHEAQFSIDTFWIDTLSSNKNLKFELTIEADHDGHEKSQSVLFTHR